VKLKKVLLGGGTLLVAGLIGFGIWNSFNQWIPAGHVGVFYHADGGLERKVYPPRRVFVGWMNTLYIYPVMEQAAIYTNDPDEGEVKSADAVRVTTNDNANTDFDMVVWYHVEPNDVPKIFDNYRGQPLKQIQQTVIRASLRQQASVVGKDYDAFTLMGGGRAEASAKLTALLKAELNPRGLTIDRAEFASPYPNDQIMQRITNQVNSETELRIAEINNQKASINKDIAITEAQAAAESSRLKSAQTQAKSLEILKLDSDIEAMRKWNGHVPPIKSRPGQTVIITPDTLRALTGGKSR
jgi:regulator of protease activity HflC (stomatin/prohibitin superfamily)